ncbi:MAG TPA: [Fe-S]-binding protein, partial [Chloroflexi bacterium]|nr:[Fe-S]-binding protein [Chloroflexota bacterium]
MVSAPSKPDEKAFRRRVDAAVADEQLRTALQRALPEFGRRRVRAFEDQDFSARRRRVHDIKASAMAELPDLIERFTREAEAVGAVVHRAATAEDARRIICD